MSIKPRGTTSNRLLAALPAKDRDHFLADCTSIDLPLGSILHEEGDRIRHVYFPIDSFISMLTTVDGHSTLEVGMVGNEGMCEHAPILGGTIAPLRALVQGAGATWRIEIAAFRRQLESAPLLRQILSRYVNVLIRQLAQTAACTRFHVVEKRLARWLLMTQDRAHADSFVVTQEFLAFMLGVRRAGVTKAAGMLQSAELIQYSRGDMTILDRNRLEAAACACYQFDLDIYQRGLFERTRK
ncbi:Crp/Fnr family transcriptional regulator [Pseudolysobacter antarcticus]|uniref:Crp/Fnr family transcriptional regulator n=1 Tax=Pseudolysobacter antarcticus TaxID=2511995 RepID=A0A411HM85_9GAMM|nr:Crp/Fnr family transcriptional regulator [Pseudolysobacter antarcticus]QBB71635.1 Crp/Fnr family transcriptional regulator [Pseudolysobacter antarcticus]